MHVVVAYYGAWVVEEPLGEAIESIRDQIVIETKFGWNINQETGCPAPTASRILVACRLQHAEAAGTDRIEIIYQHRVDAEVPIEEVPAPVKDLIAEGRLLHWGRAKWARKLCVAPILNGRSAPFRTSIQCSGALRRTGFSPPARNWASALVPWSPLGVAFMTGAINENSRFIAGTRHCLLRTRPPLLPWAISGHQQVQRNFIKPQTSA